MTYVSAGTTVVDTDTSFALSQPSMAAGNTGLLPMRYSGDFSPTGSTPPIIAGWAVLERGEYDGNGTTVAYWRYASSAVSATTINVTVPSGGTFGRVYQYSGWGNYAPTVVWNDDGTSRAYWESGAITTATAREALHVAIIFDVRSASTISNQGTITSTNTAITWVDLLGLYRLGSVRSAITSATSGRVRQAWTGGNAPAYVVTFLQPVPPPAAPTGLSVTGGARSLDVSFDAVSGADSYRLEMRRTDLTPPTGGTQTSPPSSLSLVNADVWTWDGDGVTVYVVDTGLRDTHDDFVGVPLTGWNRPGLSGDWDVDSYGHGTECASTAFGVTRGVAKGASGHIVRLGANADVMPPTLAWFEAAVDHIIAHHASAGTPGVVNYSSPLPGDPEFVGSDPADFDAAVAKVVELLDAGLHVTMAEGNSYSLEAAMPSELQGRVAMVGGTTLSAAFWNDGGGVGSNYSPSTNILAPAKDVPVAYNTGDSNYGTDSGTSFAAPMVAGAIAKILEGNPLLSQEWVLRVLISQGQTGVTGQPAGYNLPLLDAAATPADWFSFSTTSTTLTLDGLDEAATYEIRVRTVDNGLESAASGTDSATTDSAAPITIAVDASALVLTGQTPTISGSGAAPIGADPGVIVLTAVTPALAGTGAVLIPVDTAVLTLTGVTTGAAGSGAATIGADVGSIVVAGVDLSLVAGTASIAVDPATLTLGGVDSAIEGAGAATVALDPAELTLAGVTPSTVSPVLITVDPAILTLAGQDVVVAGSGAGSIAADVAILALAGQDSTLAGVSAMLAVDAALLALSGQTPLLTGSGQANAAVDAAALTLAAEDAGLAGTGGTAVAVDAGMLTLVGMAPVIDGGPIFVHVDVALLDLMPVTPSLAGTSVSVLVDPAGLLLAGVTAILATSNNRDITVTGMIDPRRWGANLTPRTKIGTISPRRWEGQL